MLDLGLLFYFLLDESCDKQWSDKANTTVRRSAIENRVVEDEGIQKKKKRKRKRKRKRKGKRNFFRMVHDAWIHTLELPIPS
jgi:hypothetical protein